MFQKMLPAPPEEYLSFGNVGSTETLDRPNALTITGRQLVTFCNVLAVGTGGFATERVGSSVGCGGSVGA